MNPTASIHTWPTERHSLAVVQINLGTRCNQRCVHCHIGGSPDGTAMDADTARKIITALERVPVLEVEFTGGAPELNPNLGLFIERLSRAGKTLTVRTNLTVLGLPEHARLPQIYKNHGVHLAASLPCYLPENVDRQRGSGIFEKSLSVLRRLNELGYGTGNLRLDLVYNPGQASLPPPQAALEQSYREHLLENYGIRFSRLIAITNVPIGRFANDLKTQNEYEAYMELLRRSFNPAALERVMCRSLVSVDVEGFVYDCDFNQALGRRISGYEGNHFWEIDFSSFSPAVSFGEHCLACTAGSGSSCHGALLSGAGEAYCGRSPTSAALP